jgi:hypothetical protein
MEDNDAPVPRIRGGRGKGRPNYNASKFLDVVEDIQPTNNVDWEIVGERYQEVMGEAVVRSVISLKRYFNTLHKKNQKPTGSSTLDPITRRAREIYQDIYRRESVTTLGYVLEPGDTGIFAESEDADDGHGARPGFISRPSAILSHCRQRLSGKR